MPMKPLSSSSHQGLFSSFFKILSLQVKPFWVELGYFMIFSFLGFLALNVTKPRTLPSFRPHNLDVFFTSVSATTVSSMSTVEMEVFSNAQLVFMTILMFLGGEAFTSFLRLQLMKLKLVKKQSVLQNNDAFDHSSSINLDNKLEHAVINPMEDSHHEAIAKLKSIRLLTYVVFGYILVVILLGSSLVSIYITFIPCAKQILNEKGLNLHTFSIFTTVSTFANCGFVPTNENMMVFKQNSGLLLILIPQILLGNTLYAPSLRFVIWFLWKFTKRQEFENILKNSKRVGYSHIFPRFETIAIAITVLAFISVQFVAFFVNTRHTGQSVFDISSFSPAIIVLFALMMYLSSSTTFLPVDNHEERLKTKEKINRRKRRSLVKYISFSQPSCLVIFTILICLVEKDKTKNDTLNFNVPNIAFEVISAYGTVGMSVGYGCARQIKPDGHCKDTTYGFAGK
ncbi:sodium transporter HKT1-like [Capsicum annuum]|uniref:sodium transporter HKT1-like n=1 Tax=Capsicum annuum TaxID=4072 RepID=UPI001FB118D9|nr:sodium transporter HKT1-like [Capsicum annuum]